MNQLLLLDHSINIEEFQNYLKGSFISVKGYFPKDMEDKLEVIFYESLQQAVKESSSIFISVSESGWDKLLLGENGILVSISEGTEIVNASPLPKNKQKVYGIFLTAKNQLYKQIA